MTDKQLRQNAIAAMRKISAAFADPESLISDKQTEVVIINETRQITPLAALELMYEHDAGPISAIDMFQMQLKGHRIIRINGPSSAGICRLFHEPPPGFTTEITREVNADEPCITICTKLMMLPPAFTKTYKAIEEAQKALEDLIKIVYP